MKDYKIVALLMLAFCGFNASGQVIITDGDMPKVNDTIRYSTVSPLAANLNLSNTGANITWDFSGLETTGTALYEYKNALTTPYVFNFFGAMGLKIADTLGMGQTSITKVYAFYKNSSTKFVQKGYGFSMVIPGTGFPMPLKGEYTDEDEIYEFPLTYNSNYENSFNLNIPIGSAPFLLGNFYRKGTRTTVVDGWGKISTPYKSDVECIRLKSTYISKDSIAITTPALNFGIPTTTIEYKWLVKGEKIPMLEVIGTEIAGVFTPNSVRYRGTKTPDDNISIQEINKGLTLVSQNRMNGVALLKSTNLLSNNGFVTDINGRKVLDIQFTNGECIIDLSQFDRGTYIIRTENGFLKLVY